ncbi:MAG: hypothetical protein L0Y32_03940 [Nevskiales bacterium]|nr:hypothetical protein [Nevskiales bacterium]
MTQKRPRVPALIFLLAGTLQLPACAQDPSPTLSSRGAGETGAYAAREATAVRMGDTQGYYTDPEFLDSAAKATFADEHNRIWLADLDMETGLFVSASGRDLFIDEDITPLRTSFNGPEFGLDKHGWALFYTKNVDGVPRAWRATVNGDRVSKQPLTPGDRPRMSILATQDASAPSIRILYVLDVWQRGMGGKAAWAEADGAMQAETEFDKDTGVRWIVGTRSFVYVRQSGPNKGQLALYDTETGRETLIITDDGGKKSDAYAWMTPGGTLRILSAIDDRTLVFYANSGGGKPWKRAKSIDMGKYSSYGFIGSPEAVAVGEKSYVSLVVKENSGYAKADVLVIGPDTGEIVHCNDGMGAVIRTDPEIVRGKNQIFVYYNTVSFGKPMRFTPYRCATGIPVTP